MEQFVGKARKTVLGPAPRRATAGLMPWGCAGMAAGGQRVIAFPAACPELDLEAGVEQAQRNSRWAVWKYIL